MPVVTPVERRKLLALALCSLLPSGAAAVTGRINPLLLNVVETLHDVSRPDGGGDTLYVTGPDQLAADAEPEYETAHDVRRRALTATDPVHTQVWWYWCPVVHRPRPHAGTVIPTPSTHRYGGTGVQLSTDPVHTKVWYDPLSLGGYETCPCI